MIYILVKYFLKCMFCYGYETFCAIRKDHPDLPIFIMSTNLKEPLLEKCLNEGARGLIIKPPDLDKVAGTLMQVEAQNFLQAQLEKALERVKECPGNKLYEEEAKKAASDLKKVG